MKKLLVGIWLGMCLLLSSLHANVTIRSDSYQKVMKHKKAKWVKATKVVPGTEILYRNTLKNRGGQQAKKLIIVNEVPEHMIYIYKSATCQGKCDIRYSVDHGKTFAKPNRLYVTKRGKRYRARASDYTTIMWVVNQLGGHQKSYVQYRARLK